jgi:hypothetical protein
MSIDLKRLPGGAVLLITLISPGVLDHQEDRLLLSPIALRSRSLIDAEPQTGPMPPCGMEPIPAYPDVNEQAVVKSWSKSDLGRDWTPPRLHRLGSSRVYDVGHHSGAISPYFES